MEGILERFPMLAVEPATARSHSRLWAELMAEGQLIGAHDLWLAATCLSRGLTMVTANTREFDRVPGLLVETWSDEDRK
ncbi:MAG: PIN domain-containing protein [Rubrobacteraceae bacterium]